MSPAELSLMPVCGQTHLDDDVLVLQEERDGAGLNWRHLLKAHIAYDIGTAFGMLSVTLCAVEREHG